MAQLVVCSQDEAMRELLTMIGEEHHLVVTTFSHPLDALRLLETSVQPLIALFDVWLDQWDGEAQVRLSRYRAIPTRHAAIVLWDAHIVLPPTVRDEFVAQHIAVVKKPLNVDLLDVALVAAMQQVSDVPPFPTDATTASLA